MQAKESAMSLHRDLERNKSLRDRAHSPLDGRDLVGAVHRRSVRELEQLARTERARIIGNLIARACRALAAGTASLARESRLQLAAEALVYRTRRNGGRPLS
jgi:hypothetical protein